jgi:hypothetical protein
MRRLNWGDGASTYSIVMAGLAPAIHPSRMMDTRVKPAYDNPVC